MDIDEILDQLRLQRDQWDESIAAVERIAATDTPKRGRPPRWLHEARSGKAERPVQQKGSKVNGKKA
jgi:hypothetical protein